MQTTTRQLPWERERERERGGGGGGGGGYYRITYFQRPLKVDYIKLIPQANNFNV